MVVILSRPSVAPPVPIDPLRPLVHEWVTASGVTYSLSDWTQGLVLDNTGVEGLHFPRITKHSSTSRSMPGKRSRGWRAEARDVFWPIQIWGESSVEWLSSYNAFFGSIHPDRPGTWRVGFAGTFRELTICGKFDDPHDYPLDPVLEAWGSYGVTLEADQPYWRGAPVKRGPWQAASSRPFFDPAGSPGFHISRGSSFANATIDNPGDVESYPVWTIIGPLSGITVGVGDRVIEVPFALTSGQVLHIDTDPRNVTALRDGVDVTEELGFQSFAPVPSGGIASLDVGGAGSGSIAVELVPLYFRAF